MAEGADGGGNPVAELLQARAQHLVVITAERIAGNVALSPVREHLGRRRGLGGPIVHAHAHAAQGSGHEFGGPVPAGAVAGHVMHLAVESGGQPVEKVRFIGSELDARNAHPGEPQLLPPAPDLRRQPERTGRTGAVPLHGSL